MQPVVVLVGRPNVGKSTLFNRLTRTRAALVADVPGLTRDRLYGEADIGGRSCTLVDTGGLMNEDDALAERVTRQVDAAIREADLVLFLIDGRAGVAPGDEAIAERLRRANAPTLLVANKVDRTGTMVEAGAVAEAARLGLGESISVSAAHGAGCDELETAIAERLPAPEDERPDEPAEGRVKFAVVGRPNVGKSTLVNRWLGEDRQIVDDTPGTTRDSVSIPFERGRHKLLLIDTAGVRRRGRPADVIEKFSVVKSLEAIRTSDVVVLVIDAAEGIVEQDLHLLGYAIEVGTGVVIAVNKWDVPDEEQRDALTAALERRLDFARWIPVRRISALHGTGVKHVLDDVLRVARARRFDVSTSFLNQVLGEATAAHQPPSPRGRRIKLRFVHKAGSSPPRIVIHGNQTALIPTSYTRYLEGRFRDAIDLGGTPFVIEYETSENPYAGKDEGLSPRLHARRKRLIRHRKAKERRKRQ
jgi:GTP-binding protein